MNNWQPWQWPTDDLSELKTERFSCPVDGKDTEWNALILPSTPRLLGYVWLQLKESGELFCASGPNFYLRHVAFNESVKLQKAQDVCSHSSDDTTMANISDFDLDWEPSDPFEHDTSQEIQDVCSHSISNETVARIYFLNASGKLRQRGEVAKSYLLVHADGRGAWRWWPYDYTKIQYDSFYLSTNVSLRDLMRRSSSDVWQQYQQALSDPQSEASFARSWHQKTDAQQEDMLWNWPRSERERRRRELETMLRHVMWKQDSLWQDHLHWDMFVSEKGQAYLFIGDPQNGDYTVPDELQSAVTHLWRSFAPLNNEILAHECALHSPHNPYDLFHIKAPQPNQHERLEAYLRWRDWQAEHPNTP